MPNASDFRWPAEWEPQSATWIAWPHNRVTWPNYFDPIPGVFARFITELSRAQPVHVLSGPPGVSPAARDMLPDNVTVHPVATNDVWIRDYGPTFVQKLSDGSITGVDWQFNAWGGKYLPCTMDSAAAQAVCEIAKCARLTSPIVCEGGGLETDGQGTLLTTSSVLMSSTRNPDAHRTDIEAELQRCLGVRKTVWVDGGGLDGDDTDGHIDQLARFVSPGVVVAAVSTSSSDSNHEGLASNLQTLQQTDDAQGRRLTVIPLPIPLPRFVDQRRVPESYCNFLLANGIAVVPTFRSSTDDAALRLLEQLFPDRRIVPMDAFDLIWGLGAFHCASQHQPAPRAVTKA